MVELEAIDTSYQVSYKYIAIAHSWGADAVVYFEIFCHKGLAYGTVCS